VRRSLVVVSLFLAGCGRAEGPGGAPSGSASRPSTVTVEVITDVAAIGSARKRVAQEEARILDAYFAGFNKASLDDYEINRRFRGRPDVNARLLTIRDDGKGDPLERARAAQLLCQFKDQTCWEGFARLLSAVPPVAARALSQFGELDDGIEFPPEHIIKQSVTGPQSVARCARRSRQGLPQAWRA
jgi:hypothetical protein